MNNQLLPNIFIVTWFTLCITTMAVAKEDHANTTNSIQAHAAHMADADPLVFAFKAQWAEWRPKKSGDIFGWKGKAWAGYDVNKLVFKTEGEQELKGVTEAFELQALYNRAISTFWDAQIGWRVSRYEEGDVLHWGVISLEGIAPYLDDVETSLFLGGHGAIALRFEIEKEIVLTKRVIIMPSFEANFYSKSEEVSAIGKGLSNLSAGVRLHYFMQPEFAPYIGFHWEGEIAEAKRFARRNGDNENDIRLTIGVRLSI